MNTPALYMKYYGLDIEQNIDDFNVYFCCDEQEEENGLRVKMAKILIISN